MSEAEMLEELKRRFYIGDLPRREHEWRRRRLRPSLYHLEQVFGSYRQALLRAGIVMPAPMPQVSAFEIDCELLEAVAALRLQLGRPPSMGDWDASTYARRYAVPAFALRRAAGGWGKVKRMAGIKETIKEEAGRDG